MTIQFELRASESDKIRFCKYIISWIRREMTRRIKLPKVQSRVDLLYVKLTSYFNYKPSAVRLINDAKKLIQFRLVKNRVFIYFDEYAYADYFKLPLLVLIKAIDLGFDDITGCYFIHNIFTEYQRNIYDYWLNYKIRTHLRLGIRRNKK